jgi:hypothetical protein
MHARCGAHCSVDAYVLDGVEPNCRRARHCGSKS